MYSAARRRAALPWSSHEEPASCWIQTKFGSIIQQSHTRFAVLQTQKEKADYVLSSVCLLLHSAKMVVAHVDTEVHNTLQLLRVVTVLAEPTNNTRSASS